MDNMTREELEQRIYEEFAAMLSGHGLTDEQYEGLMDDRKEPVEVAMRYIDSYAKKYGEKQYNLGFSEGEDYGKHQERKKTQAKVLEARIETYEKAKAWAIGFNQNTINWIDEDVTTLQAERGEL